LIVWNKQAVAKIYQQLAMIAHSSFRGTTIED